VGSQLYGAQVRGNNRAPLAANDGGDPPPCLRTLAWTRSDCAIRSASESGLEEVIICITITTSVCVRACSKIDAMTTTSPAKSASSCS
jgi:hypothetical protein